MKVGDTLLQVNVSSTQAHQLASPCARGERHHNKGIQAGVMAPATGGKKPLALRLAVLVEVARSADRLGRALNPTLCPGGILVEPSAFDSVGKYMAQHRQVAHPSCRAGRSTAFA